MNAACRVALVAFRANEPGKHPKPERGGRETYAQEDLMQYQSIRVVRPGQLDSATAQTPGSQRFAAIHAGAGIESPMWGGLFLVEPGARTGIHHHGEQHTIAYVLSGSSYVRWGERGEFNATLQAGDFLFVPAWLPHQEINPSSEVPFQWIVVRSTSEPIVVNLSDDFWGDIGLGETHLRISG
jgi:uncharacterized RmlC-like cupin family protein